MQSSINCDQRNAFDQPTTTALKHPKLNCSQEHLSITHLFQDSIVHYLLPCTCGHSIPISRSQAGTTIQCPMCKAILEIPTIRGMATLIPIDQPSESSNASRLRTDPLLKRSPRSFLRAGMMATFLGIFVIAGLTTGRWAIIRALTPTPYTVDDEIKEGDENISKFSPSNAWDAWQFYQTRGLKEKTPATYYKVKRMMELQDKNMMIGGIVTSLAFAGIVISILWPKRRRPAK